MGAGGSFSCPYWKGSVGYRGSADAVSPWEDIRRVETAAVLRNGKKASESNLSGNINAVSQIFACGEWSGFTVRNYFGFGEQASNTTKRVERFVALREQTRFDLALKIGQSEVSVLMTIG